MVIAGITIDSSLEKKLAKLGVKDSKLLSPKRREQLATKILEIAKSKSVSGTIIIPIPPCKIDGYRKKRVNLNMIETRTMAEIIDIIGGDKIYVDALTARPDRFKQKLLQLLQTKRSAKDIIAENDADKKYTVVAAASILAKVERDRAIEEIKRKVEFDFGAGYPHDERTIKFVEKLIKSGPLPSYVRKSWITTQVLKEKRKKWQRKLIDFIKKLKGEK